MSTTAPPWGTTRMGPFVESGPVPAITSVIDPETQVAVYYDDQGREIEMGAHGTSTNTSTPTTTGGGDGRSGEHAQPSDIDSMPANDQDQGTG
ncbi:putative ATP-grasp-modified RiPP [Kitasatospora sp. NBC_01287]|uniref:putative ATP-grasp-modified RiPP n=1 Tax=Kitasatospora sp. NBC_01287 TaxID=2903573 RepID=UPI00225B3C59|nr:putative ATP-grasp-modified RiPP [Kitasatospora sp. NBC_01287]MCX4747259.1 putative ATP-grasp-modified RiPP [Kitasatospora sp. NBC_01287]